MSSEPSKSWNHVRLLQAASEGLKNMGDLHAVQKQEKKAKKKKEESASLGKAEQEEEDVGQEESPASPELPSTAESEGVDQERLADLRSHLRAQFSIGEQAEDPTSDGQLMKLVGNLVHGEDDKALPVSTNESFGGQSSDCPLCVDDSTSHCSGLSMDVQKALQRDLAELKEELVASIETMKTEVIEELQSLRETLCACNDHHFLQDLSPLKELDENTLDQLKGSPYRIPEGGKLGNTISQEEKFKSRLVPTLHPLHVSGRNQAMFRAVNAITARNGFYSSLSRSNSDPVEPAEAQSIVLPPAVPKSASKKPLRKMAPASTPKTYSSNGKYGGKMGFKMAHHHLPCEGHEGQPH